MSYNLYVRKPKKGKLISPKISKEEFERAICDSKSFILKNDAIQSSSFGIFKAIESEDKLVIELHPDGQIITGWRKPLKKNDPYLLALLDLAKRLSCEIIDEYGEIIYQSDS